MAINTLYVDGGVLKSASRTFNNQNPRNIRLERFFQPAIFKLLQKKLYHPSYKLKFHPYKYKYLTTKLKEIDSFLNGRYFDDLIKKILNIKKYKLKYEIRKFEAGNYTLLHDTEKEENGIDFVIDISKINKIFDDAQNFSNSGISKDANKYFGGYTAYLTESEELLKLTPSPNSISFVERKNQVLKYTKYFTHQNKNTIVQVAGTIIHK